MYGAILILVFSVFFAEVTSSKAAASPGDCIRIAVASNMYPVMQKIAVKFQNKHSICTDLMTGSTGMLYAQIIYGAPADIYLPADMNYATRLFQNGYTTDRPIIIAYGSLYLWSKVKTDIQSNDQITLSSDIKKSTGKIAIANPELAPFGKAAKEWLEDSGAYEVIENRGVFGENISQVNRFIITGMVDWAFTSNSAPLLLEGKNTGTFVKLRVSAGQQNGLAQSMVILKKSNHQKASRLFAQFLFESESKDLLQKYGYVVTRNEGEEL